MLDEQKLDAGAGAGSHSQESDAAEPVTGPPAAEPAAAPTAGPTTTGPAKPDVLGAVAPEAEPVSYERLFVDNLSALLRTGNTDGGKKGSSGSPVALARLVNLSRKLANVDQTSALFRQAYLAPIPVT